MIFHIVLFKFKQDAKKEAIEEIYNNIYNLKNRIPGIISISGGENNSPENDNKGFIHGFVMKFKDLESRDNYLPHPAHKEVIKRFILPILDDVLVFDYEISHTV